MGVVFNSKGSIRVTIIRSEVPLFMDLCRLELRLSKRVYQRTVLK